MATSAGFDRTGVGLSRNQSAGGNISGGGQAPLTDIPVDYSPWQRTTGRDQLFTPQLPASAVSNAFVVGRAPSTAPTPPWHAKPPCPKPPCNCDWNIAKLSGKARIAKKLRAEDALYMLQLQVAERRKTLRAFKRQERRLLKSNLKLKDTVDCDEAQTHDAVKQLLQKYQKFSSGVFNMSTKFEVEFKDMVEDIEQTNCMVEVELAKIQVEVDKVDEKLQVLRQELYVMSNYKDKEYPVKALRISELQRELSQLKIQHQEEDTKLQHIIAAELDKMQKSTDNTMITISHVAAQEVVRTNLDPSVSEMASHNKHLEKEINLHYGEIHRLERQIQDMRKDIKQLLADPCTDLRRHVFPELYPTDKKCTPDMDVVLDIPTQTWLPI